MVAFLRLPARPCRDGPHGGIAWRLRTKKAVIFRPHNIYGPNMGYKHVIPELIIKTIKGAGCNASRSNFVGAYFSALNGVKGIPNSWIKKTLPAKNIIKIYKKI